MGGPYFHMTPARYHVVLVEFLGGLFFDGTPVLEILSLVIQVCTAVTSSRWVFVCETRSAGFMHLSIVYAPLPPLPGKGGADYGIRLNWMWNSPTPGQLNFRCKSPPLPPWLTQRIGSSACKTKVAMICSAQKQENKIFEIFQIL